MTKKQQKFEMTYNLRRKVVRNMKIVTEFLPLTITGVYYCDTNFSKLDVYNRYDMDIEEIIWNGNDVKELLDFTGATEEIEGEIIAYAPNYFTQENAA